MNVFISAGLSFPLIYFVTLARNLVRKDFWRVKFCSVIGRVQDPSIIFFQADIVYIKVKQLSYNEQENQHKTLTNLVAHGTE